MVVAVVRDKTLIPAVTRLHMKFVGNETHQRDPELLGIHGCLGRLGDVQILLEKIFMVS